MRRPRARRSWPENPTAPRANSTWPVTSAHHSDLRIVGGQGEDCILEVDRTKTQWLTWWWPAFNPLTCILVPHKSSAGRAKHSIFSFFFFSRMPPNNMENVVFGKPVSNLPAA